MASCPVKLTMMHVHTVMSTCVYIQTTVTSKWDKPDWKIPLRSVVGKCISMQCCVVGKCIACVAESNGFFESQKDDFLDN